MVWTADRQFACVRVGATSSVIHQEKRYVSDEDVG